jgi:bla regulator protein BlaR1
MHSIDPLFDWFLSATVRGSLLILAVLLVQAAFGSRIPAVWRHALWLPVLFVLSAPCLPESPWSLENGWAAGAVTPAALPVDPALSHPAEPGAAAAVLAPATRPVDWRRIAGAIWIAGAFALFLTGLIACRRTLVAFRREQCPLPPELREEIREAAQSRGLRRVPRVLVSAAVPGPAMTGLCRPLLLLPATFAETFDREERRLILLHEFTHVKRGDLLLNALVFGLQALHWCNPLVWFAFLRLRADRELACDSAVLSASREDGRSRYGHALLKVESAVGSAPWRLGFVGLVGLFGRGRILHSRIAAIAGHRPGHALWNLAGPALLLVLALTGATQAQNEPAAKGGGKEIQITTQFVEAGDESMDPRLERLILPVVELRQVSLPAAVAYLEAKTREVDPGLSDIDFVLSPEAAENKNLTSLSLKDVPLNEALRYLSQLTGTSVVKKKNVIIFEPRSGPDSEKAPTPMPAKAPAPGRTAGIAEGITLPRIEFNEAALPTVLQFLQQKSIDLDPERKGIHLVLSAPGEPVPESIRISLSLRAIPLSDALRYVAEIAKLKLRYDDDAAVFYRD